MQTQPTAAWIHYHTSPLILYISELTELSVTQPRIICKLLQRLLATRGMAKLYLEPQHRRLKVHFDRSSKLIIVD